MATKMSVLPLKRGRKRKQADIPAQQNTLLDMGYKVTTQERPDLIVKSILNDVIDNLVLPATKKHDGSKVTPKTLDEWKKAYPWLLANENKLSCSLSTQFKMNNVFAHEGTPNVQKSSVERHNGSYEHRAAEKMYEELSTPDYEYSESDYTNDTLDAMILRDDINLFRTVYAVSVRLVGNPKTCFLNEYITKKIHQDSMPV